MLDRRAALATIGFGTAGIAATGWAAGDGGVDLGFAGGRRALTRAFPGKAEMILQRMRAPLLETPMTALDGQVFTPNDRFFVRWHYSDIPTAVDPATFRLRVGGAVKRPLAIPLGELLKLPRVEMAAVNQCSGNSRGFFTPRVPGAQWGNGAIGNAKWTGVRLKDVLDLAGVAPGARQVRVSGLDRPPPDAPWFAKALEIDHARDGEVMIAFAMNDAPLPLLNGFPIRLIVPGWFSTYWVKALDRIEVLSAPDTGFWMEKAYRIPATPGANVAPGAKDFPTVPINRMVPRAFFTNVADTAATTASKPLYVRGLAMGGASAVARVDLSMDAGASWHAARLGRDEGRYGFRLWEATLPPLARGGYRLWVRCTNADREAQPMQPTWNPGGFMRNPAESIAVRVA
ncbi:Oxidase [Sphingomonas sp. EC-HK361]|uniref:molybdopterin-dependent oxidoreductase n=1 Tax=Sphingomonas sp. EC-HK361 TaxID=2038397 RepID=UPI001252E95F|nr:molybdopterin-dependent oxidoreductase [Sphingomonas sp. EC-HK361]VVS97260.1 Oxidase [Sphingomonas sp. EC-HK361]